MNDRIVTVFGGSGFLGRYVVQALLASGARVRIAARDPRQGWFLKAQGGLGQTQFLAADVRKRATVLRALEGADAAVNLVGILKGDFNAFHVDGARNVAAAAAEAGVSTLVHVSAIGANPASVSAYGRSKGEGEQAVSAAFPGATILRPSIVFGREDGFINRFAGMIAALPVVPVVRGDVKFQPVYVGDVAQGVARVVSESHMFDGETLELGGPEVLTMAEVNRWIAAQIGRSPVFAPVPDFAAHGMARFGGWLPGAPMTWDQWLMLQADNVVDPARSGLARLGVTPTPLDAVAEGWLVQYRRHGRFTKRFA